MRFSIEARNGYLYAALSGREAADQMREFLLAVHAFRVPRCNTK